MATLADIVTVELVSPVGPRLIYPADLADADLDSACPVGWELDYDTPHVDAGYDSVRDCRRFSAPLRQCDRVSE